MKKWSMNIVLSALMVSYGAQAKLSNESGFSGNIAINVGFTSQASNLSTGSEALQTSGGPPTKSKILLGPLGSVQYTFGSDNQHQVFMGTSRADVAVGAVTLELGYKQELTSGMTWSFSGLPTLVRSEVWQDPYQLNGSRKKTQKFGSAYRIQLNKTPLFGLNFDLGYGHININQENSGSELTSNADKLKLNRSGKKLYSKVEKFIPLSRTTFLLPSFKYIQRNAHGAAMKNTGMGTDLTAIMIRGQHRFVGTASYLARHFDNPHPVFSVRRKEQQLKFFLAYEYDQFMGWDNTSLVAFAGYDSINSNIDFYDSNNWIMSTGLNYRF